MIPKAVVIPTAAVLPQPVALNQLAFNLNALFPHIGSAPTVTVGAGAGNGSNGSASVVTNNTSTGGIITIKSGDANNSTSSIICNLNTGVTFASLPTVIIQEGNLAAGDLNNSQGVYVVPTLTGFNLNNSTTALGTATTYQWIYLIQS